MDAPRWPPKRVARNAASYRLAQVTRRVCLQKRWSPRQVSKWLYMKTWRPNYPKRRQSSATRQEHRRDQSLPLLVWRAGSLMQPTMKSFGTYSRLVWMFIKGYRNPYQLLFTDIDCSFRYPKIDSTWRLTMTRQEKSATPVTPHSAASLTSLVFSTRAFSTCHLVKRHKQILCTAWAWQARTKP